jgi:adenine-specific DNA-methyltransferase
MRYIGNKNSLVQDIDNLIKRKKLDKRSYTFCDAFSGTGAVSEHFKDKFRIIANDIQYYSYIMSQAKLNTPDMSFSRLGFDPFTFFNKEKNIKLKGFIYNNYADKGSERKYFSAENGLKVDYIRNTIEEWKELGKISYFEYCYLIASLLESVSKVSNVAGVYGSYLKSWDPRAIKEMPFIRVEQGGKDILFEAEVHNRKIEDLIHYISGDILYLDPPYTKNQYSVQYHLLETIAKYDNPDIKGKGGLRNTSETSSSFCKKGDVEVIFEKIIAKAKFKYIILSYSSDGIMSKKYIENILKRYGKPQTYEFLKINYKKYKNHQTKNKKEHLEYLFFVEKKSQKDVVYSSPLNYQGGKHDLINFIKENLPQTKIKRFIDVFGGGYNVGLNVNASQIIYNDYNHKVVELIEMFKNTETNDLIKYFLSIQKKYKLDCGKKDAYIKLRDKYNSFDLSKRDPKMLYILILYSFNQQIRFNSLLDFNNPIGPAGLNENILEKIITFSRRIQEQNIIFLARDFDKLNRYINKNSFVYCDPPYLITLGSYNDGKRGFNGWSEVEEKKLYKFLDKLDKKNVKFMLSNVLEHKGKSNTLLDSWIKTNTKYKLIKYNKKTRKNRQEILIVNY